MARMRSRRTTRPRLRRYRGGDVQGTLGKILGAVVGAAPLILKDVGKFIRQRMTGEKQTDFRPYVDPRAPMGPGRPPVRLTYEQANALHRRPEGYGRPRRRRAVRRR